MRPEGGGEEGAMVMVNRSEWLVTGHDVHESM